MRNFKKLFKLICPILFLLNCETGQPVSNTVMEQIIEEHNSTDTDTLPAVTSQPANQAVEEGETATFSVVAIGTTPLSYQWQKGNSNVAGATDSTYTTPNTTASDDGSTFRCIVRNSAGSDTSNVATLSVYQKYTVTYNGNSNTDGSVPSSQTKTQGIALTLASNTGNLVKTGFTFAGWNTSANGNGTDYAVGASYTTDANVTLYAKWTTVPTYIAYYPFSGNANDMSGNGHNGTINGAVLTTDRFGNANSAYLFDGVNDFISVNPLAKAEHEEFTINVWAKGKRVLTCFKTPAYESYFHQDDSAVGYHLGHFVNVPNAYGVIKSLGNLSESFHMYTITAEMISTSSYKATIYVDGSYLAEKTYSYSIPAWSYLEIGRNVVERNGQYDGVIDDVRIYNRVLNESEVTALFQEGD